MKRLLLTLILTLSLQSLTVADEITEFEIENMSIGESVLDFFTEEDIEQATDESYSDRKYLTKTFFNENFNLYDAIQLSYKANDKKKIIVSIVGVILYQDNMKDCKELMYKISSELTDLFPTTAKKDWGKYDNGDNSGHYFPITFYFDDDATAMVSCHDWKKETGIDDSLKVSLFEKKYSKYIEGR